MFGQVATGDLVRVRTAPRSGKLVSLTRSHQDVTAAAEPDGLLLTTAEVAEALGEPVSLSRFGVPGGQGAIFRGGSQTLSVTVSASAVAGIGQRAGRRGAGQCPRPVRMPGC